MTDDLELGTETAKAVGEVAKTGRAVIEADSNLATFAGRVLGTLPEDTIGLLGADYLRHLRIRNMDRIARRTEEILEQRKVKEPTSLNPKVAIPALEAASGESDPTLQELWARLLANAMDPVTDVSLEKLFIDTLSQFEPFDALVLTRIGKHPATPKDIAGKLERRPTQVMVALLRLERLSCVAKTGGNNYLLTALGTELLLACQAP